MTTPLLFIPPGASAPPRSLAVDGPVPAAAMVYSHWRDAELTPEPLLADTSTGMLVLAAQSSSDWLEPYDQVVVGHVDGDGLLSALVAVRPELGREHGELLIAAATSADFQAWTSEAGFRLRLRLHQHLRHYAGAEQAGLDALVANADQLLNEAASSDPERDAEVGQVLAAREAVAAGHIAITQAGALAVVRWRRQRGHPWDRFLDVHQPDDLPVWALTGAIPPHRLQLMMEETAAGTVAVLEAPRHSWARTIDLPTVPWPDLSACAAALQAEEPLPVTWTAGPGGQGDAFTGLLAVVQDGKPAASGVAPERIAAVIGARLSG